MLSQQIDLERLAQSLKNYNIFVKEIQPLSQGSNKQVYIGKNSSTNQSLIIKVATGQGCIDLRNEYENSQKINFSPLRLIKIDRLIQLQGEGIQFLIGISNKVGEQSLQAIIESGQQPNLQNAQQLLIDSLFGILDCSMSNIQHNDIKPSNIVMKNNKYYLIDFSSSPTEKCITQYYCPENNTYENFKRYDIYSLGITLLQYLRIKFEKKGDQIKLVENENQLEFYSLVKYIQFHMLNSHYYQRQTVLYMIKIFCKTFKFDFTNYQKQLIEIIEEGQLTQKQRAIIYIVLHIINKDNLSQNNPNYLFLAEKILINDGQINSYYHYFVILQIAEFYKSKDNLQLCLEFLKKIERLEKTESIQENELLYLKIDYFKLLFQALFNKNNQETCLEYLNQTLQQTEKLEEEHFEREQQHFFKSILFAQFNEKENVRQLARNQVGDYFLANQTIYDEKYPTIYIIIDSLEAQVILEQSDEEFESAESILQSIKQIYKRLYGQTNFNVAKVYEKLSKNLELKKQKEDKQSQIYLVSQRIDNFKKQLDFECCQSKLKEQIQLCDKEILQADNIYLKKYFECIKNILKQILKNNQEIPSNQLSVIQQPKLNIKLIKCQLRSEKLNKICYDGNVQQIINHSINQSQMRYLVSNQNNNIQCWVKQQQNQNSSILEKIANNQKSKIKIKDKKIKKNKNKLWVNKKEIQIDKEQSLKITQNNLLNHGYGCKANSFCFENEKIQTEICSRLDNAQCLDVLKQDQLEQNYQNISKNSQNSNFEQEQQGITVTNHNQFSQKQDHINDIKQQEFDINISNNQQISHDCNENIINSFSFEQEQQQIFLLIQANDEQPQYNYTNIQEFEINITQNDILQNNHQSKKITANNGFNFSKGYQNQSFGQEQYQNSNESHDYDIQDQLKSNSLNIGQNNNSQMYHRPNIQEFEGSNHELSISQNDHQQEEISYTDQVIFQDELLFDLQNIEENQRNIYDQNISQNDNLQEQKTINLSLDLKKDNQNFSFGYQQQQISFENSDNYFSQDQLRFRFSNKQEFEKNFHEYDHQKEKKTIYQSLNVKNDNQNFSFGQQQQQISFTNHNKVNYNQPQFNYSNLQEFERDILQNNFSQNKHRSRNNETNQYLFDSQKDCQNFSFEQEQNQIYYKNYLSLDQLQFDFQNRNIFERNIHGYNISQSDHKYEKNTINVSSFKNQIQNFSFGQKQQLISLTNLNQISQDLPQYNYSNSQEFKRDILKNNISQYNNQFSKKQINQDLSDFKIDQYNFSFQYKQNQNSYIIQVSLDQFRFDFQNIQEFERNIYEHNITQNDHYSEKKTIYISNFKNDNQNFSFRQEQQLISLTNLNQISQNLLRNHSSKQQFKRDILQNNISQIKYQSSKKKTDYDFKIGCQNFDFEQEQNQISYIYQVSLDQPQIKFQSIQEIQRNIHEYNQIDHQSEKNTINLSNFKKQDQNFSLEYQQQLISLTNLNQIIQDLPQYNYQNSQEFKRDILQNNISLNNNQFSKKQINQDLQDFKIDQYNFSFEYKQYQIIQVSLDQFQLDFQNIQESQRNIHEHNITQNDHYSEKKTIYISNFKNDNQNFSFGYEQQLISLTNLNQISQDLLRNHSSKQQFKRDILQNNISQIKYQSSKKKTYQDFKIEGQNFSFQQEQNQISYIQVSLDQFQIELQNIQEIQRNIHENNQIGHQSEKNTLNCSNLKKQDQNFSLQYQQQLISLTNHNQISQDLPQYNYSSSQEFKRDILQNNISLNNNQFSKKQINQDLQDFKIDQYNFSFEYKQYQIIQVSLDQFQLDFQNIQESQRNIQGYNIIQNDHYSEKKTINFSNFKNDNQNFSFGYEQQQNSFKYRSQDSQNQPQFNYSNIQEFKRNILQNNIKQNQYQQSNISQNYNQSKKKTLNYDIKFNYGKQNFSFEQEQCQISYINQVSQNQSIFNFPKLLEFESIILPNNNTQNCHQSKQNDLNIGLNFNKNNQNFSYEQEQQQISYSNQVSQDLSDLNYQKIQEFERITPISLNYNKSNIFNQLELNYLNDLDFEISKYTLNFKQEQLQLSFTIHNLDNHS
ncbi:hypothetical protein ABPG74_017243 [Tetrahymena malaccensis]